MWWIIFSLIAVIAVLFVWWWPSLNGNDLVTPIEIYFWVRRNVARLLIAGLAILVFWILFGA